MRCQLMVFALAAMSLVSVTSAQDRETKVRKDKRDVLEEGFWVYNDWKSAQESARVRGREYEPMAHPALFSKAPTTVIGPYDDIPYPTGVTEQVDWEVELAVVIGRKARTCAWRPRSTMCSATPWSTT